MPSRLQSSAAHDGGFRHEAFFYSDVDELLGGVVPFLQEGIDAEEGILVAMPDRNLELVKAALDGEPERVQFIEMEELGRNPARIIPAWSDFLASNLAAGRGLRGIGEPIWFGRTRDEIDECQRHESLLNLAFERAPTWSLMCPYDAARLEDDVLRAAEHSHPVLSGDRARSAEFADPGRLRPFAGRLERPAAQIETFRFGLQELREVRRFLRDRGRHAGLSGERLDDMVLAGNELATNSILHGGGGGTILAWVESGDLVCEFQDRGRFDEPLVGRKHPPGTQVSGRGLWLVNQLCDLVQIRSDESGNQVRARIQATG